MIWLSLINQVILAAKGFILINSTNNSNISKGSGTMSSKKVFLIKETIWQHHGHYTVDSIM